jgi:hypothetical protein
MQQELADLARHQAQKMADLQQSLEAEYQLIVAYEQKKQAAIIQSAIDIQKKIQAVTGFGSTPTPTPTAPSAPRRRSFHGGGIVPGATGSEVPATLLGGESVNTIAQTRAMFTPPAPIGGGSSVTTNTTTNAPTINVSESMFDDPVAMAKFENAVLRIMSRQ